MSWILLVIAAVVLDSSRIFIDNYVSDVYFKGKYTDSQKLFYGYAFILATALILLVFRISLSAYPIETIIWLIISGILPSIAGIFYYKALEVDDSVNLTIFIQMAPILYSIIGWCFLGEAFHPMQLVAFGIIFIAPMMVVFSSRKNSRKTKLKAAFLSFLYVVFAVVGNIIFAKITTTDTSMTSIAMALAFTFLGKGLTNLVIVYTQPKKARYYRKIVAKTNGRVRRPMILCGIIGLSKDFAYRTALVVAPTMALASAASDSVEPIVTFFIGIILTLISPKIGREKLDKKSILVQLFAIIIVISGIVLLKIYS